MYVLLHKMCLGGGSEVEGGNREIVFRVRVVRACEALREATLKVPSPCK